MHNQKEDNNQSKNNKQPEVPENWTAWNSDNQGIKEIVNQTGARRQRNRAQMKAQSKTPEKELGNEEIANLSDVELKTLKIKVLTELIELGWKMKEQMKTTQSEIKQNIRGTNSDRKETRTQINDLEQKEEINIHPEDNEETRIQKNEERFRNLWDNLKCSNIWIIRLPEREEQQQEIENLFEQIMKANFPIWQRK